MGEAKARKPIVRSLTAAAHTQCNPKHAISRGSLGIPPADGGESQMFFLAPPPGLLETCSGPVFHAGYDGSLMDAAA